MIDGSPVHVKVSSATLTDYFDKVYVTLYNGDDLQDSEKVSPNQQFTMSTLLMKPGLIVGRAGLATTYCSIYSNDRCSLDSDFNWYQFVYGLSYPDSAPATAKYGSKLSLSAVNDGTRTTWTATAQQYGGYGWQPWKAAAVTIGQARVLTNDKGVATWVEATSQLHSLTATAEENSEVWGSTSAAARPSAPPAASAPRPPASSTPPTRSTKPPVRVSSSAATAGKALAKKVKKVRKVIKLTKRNDANHLLGKKHGYLSAAVLVDRRLRCKGEPGVDCGATVEKFASAAKAKQRKRYIQSVLHRLPILGKERDVVEGRFLLRVSGKLPAKRATAYEKAFRALL
ncbi:hypothetical protein [Amnibacterium endophyticum]|uniref:Uncharacterized protein n=1 Tax=Amnibacterium endophyticum TaxID=2109337 RepID=A0ABW4LDP8_9MICO